jgi:hypothetical protein
MRLLSGHIQFIAEKIARELSNSKLVTFSQGDGPVVKAASAQLTDEIELEKSVDAEVNRIMGEKEEDIDFYQADRKQLFRMIKRKVAAQRGLILETDDRFNNLAHRILDELYEEDLINYTVSENLIKNLIGKAILDYGRRQDEIEEIVHEKLRHYKRSVIRGTEEYEILFAKLCSEELSKLGM